MVLRTANVVPVSEVFWNCTMVGSGSGLLAIDLLTTTIQESSRCSSLHLNFENLLRNLDCLNNRPVFI